MYVMVTLKSIFKADDSVSSSRSNSVTSVDILEQVTAQRKVSYEIVRSALRKTSLGSAV